MACFKKKNTEENIEAAAQAEWDGSSQESFAGNVAAVVEEVKVKGIENLRTYKRDRYILGIIAIFVGLLFLLWPGQSCPAGTVLRFSRGEEELRAGRVGALLVVSGLVALIMYFTNQERALIGGALVVIGIIIGVIGIWIILHPEVLVGLAPKIIGLILIFSGLTGIGETVTLIRLDYDFWWLTLLLTSITIAVGVVLFVRPMEVASLFARIVGLTFLYDGITSIWITSRISAGVKKAKEAVHQFGQDVAQNLSALGGAAATAAGSAFGSEASENASEDSDKPAKKRKGLAGLFGRGKKKEVEEAEAAEAAAEAAESAAAAAAAEQALSTPEEFGTGFGSRPDFFGTPAANTDTAPAQGDAIPLGGPVEDKTEEKKDDFDDSIFIP